MSIGENIKKIRKEKGITQKELGKMLGVSQSAIGQFENDKSNPKIETIVKIANALDVNVSCLINTDEYNNLIATQVEEKILNAYIEASTYEDIEEIKKPDLLKQRTKYYTLYNQLNCTGKLEAVKRVEELTEIKRYTEKEEPPTDS